jgi:hypothetical protein
VDDALVAAAQVKEGDAVLLGVAPQGLQHVLGQRVLEGLGAVVGGDDVVHGGEGAVGIAHLEAQVLQHPKGLGARDLVEEVEVYEKLALPIPELSHLVGLPNFVVKRFSHAPSLEKTPGFLGPGGCGAKPFPKPGLPGLGIEGPAALPYSLKGPGPKGQA